MGKTSLTLNRNTTMKHIFKTLLLALCLMGSTNIIIAQDARQRTTTTIVQDVLALMPIQEKNVFDKEMADLVAAAPESIELLCRMMQPAEKAANNKVEYAISGTINYLTEHPEKKAQVLLALKTYLPNAVDEPARQFVSSQIRMIDTDVEPVTYTQHTGAQPYAAQWDEMMAAGKPAVLKALKSKDRATRMQALKFATDNQLTDEEMVKKVTKSYKGKADNKADIINWIGDNHVPNQEALLAKALKEGGEPADAAIEAMGKVASTESIQQLLGLLGTGYTDKALTALRSVNRDIAAPVRAAMKDAQGKKLDALLTLAYDRRIHACSTIVLMHCPANETAMHTLPGVVTRAEAYKVAKLLDRADAKQAETLQKALSAALRNEDVKDRYHIINEQMKRSPYPQNYYPVLADLGTDESVLNLQGIYEETQSKDALRAIERSDNYKAANVLWQAATDESVLNLQGIYEETQSKDALRAIKRSDNYKAANVLWQAATQQGDDEAMTRYVQLVNTHEGDVEQRCNLLTQAFNQTKNTKVKKQILGNLGAIPTLPAFTTASQQLGDTDVAYDAAYACKNIASKAAPDIDYKQLQEVLTRASDIIQTGGKADDGYAVDEIKKILSDTQPVAPTVLSDEEKKEGFQLLFDGTNLDQWQGNKVGYVPVNGTILVTANYGNEGNLYTRREYKDFVFRFEFCFLRPGVNNGVGIRTPMGVDAAYDAMCECQILDHDAPIYEGLREYQVHGSAYGIIPARRITHKPVGEWSTEEIVVKGSHIKVTVNGEVILDGDLKEACKGHNVAPDGSDNNPYTTDHRNHPGMFNTKGYISFCGHGPGVKFRNIRIKELK
ncbi:MAG: DUF1080 domain-containing protein [Bacteroidaceae bacterium]|nr:DUF1080 domain-containing protein [Bacteroidaceae bacterium]